MPGHGLVRFVLFSAMASCQVNRAALEPERWDSSIEVQANAGKALGSEVAYERQIRGELLALQGALDEARDEYAAAHDADQGDPFIAVRLAALTAAVGERRRALRILERVLEDNPSYEFGWLTVADLEAEQGQEARAVAAARRAARSEPWLPHATRWLARQARRTGESRRAAELLRRLVQADPADATALFELAEVSADLDDRATARDAALRFAELRPLAHGQLRSLATALLACGDHTTASRLLERSFWQAQGSEKQRWQLIRLFAAQGRHLEAIKQLHVLGALDVSKPEEVEQLACAYYRAGELYAAREIAASAHAARPGEPCFTLLLAEFEVAAGRLEQAELLADIPATPLSEKQRAALLHLRQQVSQWPSRVSPCR